MEQLNTTPEVLAFKLSTLTNKNLFESFVKFFDNLEHFTAANEAEHDHTMELCSIYITEFRCRLKYYTNKYDHNAILELMGLVKAKLESCKQGKYDHQDQWQGNHRFTLNTTLRLYTECIKYLRKSGVDAKFIDKNCFGR